MWNLISMLGAAPEGATPMVRVGATGFDEALARILAAWPTETVSPEGREVASLEPKSPSQEPDSAPDERSAAIAALSPTPLPVGGVPLATSLPVGVIPSPVPSPAPAARAVAPSGPVPEAVPVPIATDPTPGVSSDAPDPGKKPTSSVPLPVTDATENLAPSLPVESAGLDARTAPFLTPGASDGEDAIPGPAVASNRPSGESKVHAPELKPDAAQATTRETPGAGNRPATPEPAAEVRIPSGSEVEAPKAADVVATLRPTEAVVQGSLLAERDVESLTRLETAPKNKAESESDTSLVAPAPSAAMAPAKAAAGDGETPDRREEPPTREAIAHIRERIEEASLHRPQRMTIRLNPDSLGEVVLTLKQAGSTLVADFAATDDRMRHALAEHRQALAASLELKQIQLQDFRVVEAQPGQGVAANLADRRSPQHPAHDPRLPFAQTRGTETEPASNPPARTWATTGLDLRI